MLARELATATNARIQAVLSMDALVELASFRISYQLYQKILKFVDEI